MYVSHEKCALFSLQPLVDTFVLRLIHARYFVRQMSFVTSRRHSAARLGRKLSGIR